MAAHPEGTRMKEISFTLLGIPLLFRTNSGYLAEFLPSFLGAADMQRDPLPGATIAALRLPESALDHPEDPEKVMPFLARAVHRIAVALNSRFLFLHACGIVFNKRAFLFCGRSESGKTTLAMMAQILGYEVLGEDMVAVEWEAGMVYPLSIPFRPRPFTRKLVSRWAQRSGAGEIGFPHRPRACPEGRPLDTVYLQGIGSRSRLEALLKSSFGRPDIPDSDLLLQAARAVRKCRIISCDKVNIDPDIQNSELAAVFRSWAASGLKIPPAAIFGPR